MSEKSDKPTTFVRTASGLVRVFGAWDMFMYSVLTMVVMTTGMWVYIYSPFAWPGANVPIGIIITTVWGASMILVYAMMASSMPRSGGEYVWQSRLLHPALGFAITFVAWPLFVFYWTTEGATVACQMGISPILLYLGNIWHNPGLTDLAAQFFSNNTYYIIVGTILNLSVFLVILPGLKLYLKLQWILFFGLIASWITVLAIFLTSNNATFISAFNSHMLSFNPGMTNAYQKVIDTATTGGFNANASFSLFGTLGVMSLAWWALCYPMQITLAAGEIKNATNLKRMTTVMFASLFVCGIFMAVVGWATINVVGYPFMNALSTNFFTGGMVIPAVFPFYTALAAILVNNPILIILIFIGIIFNGWQLLVNCYIGFSRTVVAPAFDRVLPAWFSRISKRFPGSPINTYFTLFVGTEIMLFVWQYVQTYALTSQYVIDASFLFTMIAAIVFPFRKDTRDIWKASPASKYKWVLIASALIAIPFLLLQIYYYTVTSALGINSVPVIAVIWGLVVVFFIYYYVRRYQLRSKGIELDLNFKTVPPA